LKLFENYDAFMVTGQQHKTTCNREGILPMSIGFSGLATPCCIQPVTIEVSPTHPLIQLAQVIPWQALADMVLPDLKRTTTKGKWWLGRKLTLRIHLGACLLQGLYTLTDRQVEWAIRDNAAYQLFCGRGLVDLWHAPDHTKIEEFRSRLSPETQRQVANAVAVWATQLGFADPSAMDIDSTVQEANIAYPSDAHLMVKMTFLVQKVWMYMKQNMASFAEFIPCVDVKAVKAKARAYLFRARKDPEHTQTTFEELWHEAFMQIHPVKKSFDVLLDSDIHRMPWNIRRALEQVNKHCATLFLQVASFLCRGVVVPDKVLSFHAQAVSCFNKGKAAHKLEFGRAFQLGRIGGNFLVVGACTSTRMEAKASVCPMIEAHQGLFGQGVLQSFGTDKGYYSQTNHDYLCTVTGLKEFGLQQPGLDMRSLAESEAKVRTRLADRRAGIEPLIGHAKQGGQLGQSRMKTDDATLAAGYSAIGGFNLRQLIRHLLGKDIKPIGKVV
jgi:transposase, IS5 family